jgi:hypothetical protein
MRRWVAWKLREVFGRVHMPKAVSREIRHARTFLIAQAAGSTPGVAVRRAAGWPVRRRRQHAGFRDPDDRPDLRLLDHSLPGAAGIEGAIGAAITAVETNISSPNNITVDIDFTNMSSGLGESTTGFYAPT